MKKILSLLITASLLLSLIPMTISIASETGTVGQWAAGAKLSSFPHPSSMAACDGKIAVFSRNSSAVNIYDIASNSWSQGKDRPATDNIVSVSREYSGEIYIISENDLYVYSISSDRWKRLNDGINCSAAVMYNDLYIYCLGQNGVNSYNVNTNTWNYESSAPANSNIVFSTVINNNVYAVSRESYDIVYEYDTAAKSWSQVGKEYPDNGTAISAYGNEIFWTGGYTTEDEWVESWDLVDGEWIDNGFWETVEYESRIFNSFNVNTKQSDSYSSIPKGMKDSEAVGYKGKVYLIDNYGYCEIYTFDQQTSVYDVYIPVVENYSGMNLENIEVSLSDSSTVLTTKVSGTTAKFENVPCGEYNAYVSDGNYEDNGGRRIYVSSSNYPVIEIFEREDNYYGHVYDRSTSAPISGAAVTISGTSVAGRQITDTCATDDEGVYDFTYIPRGTYTINVDKPGYPTQNVQVAVGGDDVDIYLDVETADGLIYPGSASWWSTSKGFYPYSDDYPDEKFAVCNFHIDNVNVVCKGTAYAVPTKDFFYNVILGSYDYQPNYNYLMAVKVNYGGTAEYILMDWFDEVDLYNPKFIYYDNYAVLPFMYVYSDGDGQLFGNGYYGSYVTYPYTTSNKIIDVESQRESSIALDAYGNVYTWGNGSYNDLGHGNTNNVTSPEKVEGLPKIVQIAKGKNHTLALDVDGNIWGWGNNSGGEIHGNLSGKVTTPAKIPGISKARNISAGTGYSAAIVDGHVYTWGNSGDKLGDRGTAASNQPGMVRNISDASKISCGEQYMTTLTMYNKIYTWGANNYGQLGDGTTTSRSEAVAIKGNYTNISAGKEHALAVDTKGKLYSWGKNSIGQLGLGDKNNRTEPTQISNIIKGVKDICASYSHSAAVLDDGTVWAWGEGRSGQLGNGQNATSRIPVQATGLSNIVKITAGNDFTLALDNEGKVYSFGIDTYWQIGDNAFWQIEQ